MSKTKGKVIPGVRVEKGYVPTCRLLTPEGISEVLNAKKTMGINCGYFTEKEAILFQENAMQDASPFTVHINQDRGNVPWHYFNVEKDVIMEMGFQCVGLFPTIYSRIGELEQMPLNLMIYGNYPTKKLDPKSTSEHIAAILSDSSPGTTKLIKVAIVAAYAKIAPNLNVCTFGDGIEVLEIPSSLQGFMNQLRANEGEPFLEDGLNGSSPREGINLN